MDLVRRLSLQLPVRRPTVINVHEAKTHFSKLLDRVAKGEDIVIARAGTPVAKLVPLNPPSARPLGADAGSVIVAPDFDAPLPDDVLDGFER
jgi:prevent-host-death family protein